MQFRGNLHHFIKPSDKISRRPFLGRSDKCGLKPQKICNYTAKKFRMTCKSCVSIAISQLIAAVQTQIHTPNDYAHHRNHPEGITY